MHVGGGEIYFASRENGGGFFLLAWHNLLFFPTSASPLPPSLSSSRRRREACLHKNALEEGKRRGGIEMDRCPPSPKRRPILSSMFPHRDRGCLFLFLLPQFLPLPFPPSIGRHKVRTRRRRSDATSSPISRLLF